MDPRPRGFRIVLDKQEAERLVHDLKAGGLHPELRENSAVFDVTFTAGAEKDLHVMLPPEEFERAEELLEQDAQRTLEPLAPDHFLNGFDNDELLDMLRKPDEWNPVDRAHAEKLLDDRGATIDRMALIRERDARIAELARSEKAKWTWFALAIATIWIGGSGGMVIGWSLMAARKTLPDGSQVHRYTEGDRRNGQAIFAFGLIVLLGTLVLFFRRWFS
ncbi:MAG TPA: hypothetical protein VKG92_09005 [Flavobacteriales bacterium]|nr:hypothetical protein [Flavobacteriales bacterium]